MTDDSLPMRVGVAGLGAIGMAVAQGLDRGIPGLTLGAVAARNLDRAHERISGFAYPPEVVRAADFASCTDVIVECAPASAFRSIAEPALAAGRVLIPASIGALLSHKDLIGLAERNGGRIIAPTGALIGLDAVRAAAEDKIASVRMVTRKPPASLAGAPYLAKHDIRLDGLSQPLKIFDGNAREGALGFPANVNVAAALSLAGIGPERTRLEIWADPALSRNTHHIEVEANSARFSMTIENVPSDENPRTGRITALSLLATLRRLTGTLTVGT